MKIILLITTLLLASVSFSEGTTLLELREISHCTIYEACNSIIKVDCNSAADGPTFYFDEESEELLSVCGGFYKGSKEERKKRRKYYKENCYNKRNYCNYKPIIINK